MLGEPGADRGGVDYAFRISPNYPLRDGNKRIAFLAAVIFPGLNGVGVSRESPRHVVGINQAIARTAATARVLDQDAPLQQFADITQRGVR